MNSLEALNAITRRALRINYQSPGVCIAEETASGSGTSGSSTLDFDPVYRLNGPEELTATLISTAPLDLTLDLINHWGFNGAGGPYVDSVNGDAGTINSGSDNGTVAGVCSEALRVVLPTEWNLTALTPINASFTVAGWIQVVSGTDFFVYGQTGYFSVELVSGALRFQVTSTSAVDTSVTTAALTPGQWYFFAAKWTENESISIQLDSTKTELPYLGDVQLFGVEMFSGGGGTGEFYLDDLALWNKALEDQHIDIIYNGGSALCYPYPQDADVSVYLQWTELDYAYAYVVYVATNSEGPWTALAAGVTVLNYTHQNPAPATYYYKVTGIEPNAGETYASPIASIEVV